MDGTIIMHPDLVKREAETVWVQCRFSIYVCPVKLAFVSLKMQEIIIRLHYGISLKERHLKKVWISCQDLKESMLPRCNDTFSIHATPVEFPLRHKTPPL